MIERIDGEIVIHCDAKRCAEVLETETKDFEEAREVMAEEGWKSRLIAGQWHHVCPICLDTETYQWKGS